MSCLHQRSLLAPMADIICLVLGVEVASRPLIQQNQPPYLYYAIGAICPLGLVFVGVTPMHIKTLALQNNKSINVWDASLSKYIDSRVLEYFNTFSIFCQKQFFFNSS